MSNPSQIRGVAFSRLFAGILRAFQIKINFIGERRTINKILMYSLNKAGRIHGGEHQVYLKPPLIQFSSSLIFQFSNLNEVHC